MNGAMLSRPEPLRSSAPGNRNDQYVLFETAIGACAIAWTTPESGALVTLFQFPEATEDAILRRISRFGARRCGAPPTEIRALISRIGAHLEGRLCDFNDVQLELTDEPAFARSVYDAARKIPPGQTRTYGQIAKQLGQPNAARAVGQALGNNPIPLIVPCHRIVAATSKGGGFSAHGGLKTKARLLAIERVTNDLF
jgi:O-6-methylguanine DNA methyltransferase